jgi:hypothetical protein
LFWTSPASSCRRHSIAKRRSLTTRGVLGFLGGVGLHLRGEIALPTRSAATRRGRLR